MEKLCKSTQWTHFSVLLQLNSHESRPNTIANWLPDMLSRTRYNKYQLRYCAEFTYIYKLAQMRAPVREISLLLIYTAASDRMQLHAALSISFSLNVIVEWQKHASCARARYNSRFSSRDSDRFSRKSRVLVCALACACGAYPRDETEVHNIHIYSIYCTTHQPCEFFIKILHDFTLQLYVAALFIYIICTKLQMDTADFETDIL